MPLYSLSLKKKKKKKEQQQNNKTHIKFTELHLNIINLCRMAVEPQTLFFGFKRL